MATLLHRLGLAAFRRRVTVVVVWLLVLLAAGLGAATLSGKTVSTFEIPGQESTTALGIIDESFGGSGGAGAQVVLQAPAGRTVQDPQVAGEISRVVAQLRELPGVVSASDPLDPQAPTVSRDLRTVYSSVTYGVAAPAITDAERDALTAALADARAAGLTAEATGEATQAVGQIGGVAEGLGVVAALVVLAITYGSLVAAGMNLLTAVVGVGIGALGIVTLTGFTDLQSTTPVLAVMLGLAVGIDYALFIVTRFRQELQGAADPRDRAEVGAAVAMATGTAGSAVLTAGITVVIALAGLSVAGVPFLTEMGLAAAATVVVAVLIALTLVPAVLGFVGHRALPRAARRAARQRGGRHVATDPIRGGGFFAGWARLVTTRRWPALVAGIALLGVLSVPVASLQTSLATNPPEGSTQEKASALLSEGFGAGVTGPLLVLVSGPGAVERAGTVLGEVQALPGVAAAVGPQPSADGTAALVTVVPTSGPTDEATTTLVRDLRQRFADDAAAGLAGQTRSYVSGVTAINVDVSQKLDEALPVYLALVVGLALLLLILVFRSILVPIVGVLGFLLTIGASLGTTTAVFQWGWLKDLVLSDTTGPLLSLAPIIIVGILFGLAMDYQVFLVARMHEAHAHGVAPVDAVVQGFRQAAPVVVAAAAIMFSVFAGFVPEGDATIKPIGFALAVGILADAVVVRMIVVPAALALLGRAAWWLPAWLHRMPVLDVEGAALEGKRGVVAA
ncbi:MMPL family transporter [Kineococcus gynurae]|uniref:MMPL family transporter n=1 Tax=Kineococcus gynurae TaxID=452979 RepID=A0ABV5LT86_9ACTN